MAATHTAEDEVNAALRRLVVRRVRLALVLGLASILVFAAVNHFYQPAPLAWSDRMNAAAALMLVTSLLLTARPALERHPVVLPTVVAILACGLRTWAGVWQGEATTSAIFLVTMAMTAAAMLPWGAWPQLVTAGAAGAAVAANTALVAGVAGPSPVRTVVATALGLVGSVIIAAEVRRHHRQLLRDNQRRQRAEADLARLNLELERRVEERTAQLAAATRDLAREAEERRLAAAEMRESQRRLQAVLDHADVAIYLRDLDGRYVLVNRYWQTLAGRTAAETIGRRMEEIMSPSVAAALRAHDAEVLAAPHSLQFEETVPHADGPRTYVSVKFAWIGEAGRPLGIWGLSTDITPLKQVEAELRRSEAALSALVENTSDAVWSIDRDGGLTVLNTAARRHLAQLFPAPLAPRPDAGFAALRDEFHGLYARALAGEHVQVEHTFESEAGPRYFVTSLHPIVEGGAVVGATGFAKDITRLKRAELAAREHQAELAHVLRLGTIGEIAAGLAHEINQPLGAIANYAQGCALRLRAGPVEPAVLLDVVERIAGEALRAGEVIRRLRDLVRKDDTAHAPAELNQLVRGAARLLEAEARRRGVDLRLELAPTLPTVRCDPIQIEQVLLNVMLNGVEATDGAPNALVVRTTARDGHVEVAVRDAGVGLPPPPLDVFAPFVSTKPDGLGMGLSISRSIVEAHGGRLWAVANPDRGTTFHLTLPAATDGGEDGGRP